MESSSDKPEGSSLSMEAAAAVATSSCSDHHVSMPADPTKYTILQVNGCRYNRAVNWTDPEPPTSCELYVKNIPRRFKGEDLWPLFEPYGRIYNIRVLMDYNDFNRGFAYVKYASERQAVLGMELLNYFFVFPGYRLNIQRSTDKSRLFANYIPKDVAVAVVQDKFKEIFPEMRDFFMPTQGKSMMGTRALGEVVQANLHRGFAFLEFRSHQEAVAAKKLVYTGVLEIWGAQVKISWARPSQEGGLGMGDEEEYVDFYPRIFVTPFHRGMRVKTFLDFLEDKIDVDKVVRVDLKKTIVIMKVLTVRDGEEIMRKLRGKEFSGLRLHLEWYRERNTDAKRYCFCKTLEVMCLANQWSTPVILFGRIFPDRNEQYVALFTVFRGHIFSIYAKVTLNENLDLTSRISEVFLALVEETGYLPSYNYVLEVNQDTVKIFGFVSPTMGFTRTYTAGDVNYCFYWAEMMELNWAVLKLARIDPKWLYEKYQDAIDNSLESGEGHDQYVVEGISTNNRIFSSVYNDQTNMTLLLLCDKVTHSNKYFLTRDPPIPYSTFKSPMCYGKHPQSLGLSKLKWVVKERPKEVVEG